MPRQHKGQGTKAGVVSYASKKGGKKKATGKQPKQRGRHKYPDDGFSTLSGASTSCEARCGICPTCLIAKGNQENEERMNRMGRKYS